jgi:prolyl-tRNA editing enzyme YbaK/EbsC (Cys-tRNA(Pro) deacylase)
MSKAVGRFERAARDRGLSLEILRFPEGTRTAPDAARAVGCDVGQIVKSLVFMAGTEPILALTSGDNRADLEKLSQLVGGVTVRRADAEEARAATGFGIGGTPPFGFTGNVRVFMDADLLRYDEIWAAAGTPDAVFRTTPEELRAAAGAEVADFKEGG